MRALVVYESIFGNTRQIAESVAEGLRGSLDVEVVEVVEVGQAPRRVDGVDLLVIGGPTHAWSMSRGLTRRGAREQAKQKHREPTSKGIGVREWLRELRRARGVQMAAAFDTALRSTSIPSGSAARDEAVRLEEHGYRLVSEPEQFFVRDVDGPLEAGELERAHAWGVHLAARAHERSFIKPLSRPRPVESIGAIVGNALGLALINLHELWRPWTLGVVTGEWARAVDTMSLACVVALVGHTLLLMFRSRLLQPFVGCATAGANLASAAVVYSVFPFDFGALDMEWFDSIFRLILLFAVIAAAIGLVVQIVRLLVRLARS